MATLKQYWTDEVARITTALSAQQSALTLLRGTLMSAETGQRNTAQAISAHSAELTAARSALAGIPMPADSDPLVKKMKQALVALHQAQASLATGELRVQQLRAEFARAQTQEASLKAALTDAKNTLAEEEVHSKARADLGTALSSGDPSTLVAAATAALAAHKVTALARVEDEFPSSGTDAKDFLKRARARRKLIEDAAKDVVAAEDLAYSAHHSALAKAQRHFDAAVSAVSEVVASTALVQTDIATLQRLAELPAATATRRPILTLPQHGLLHATGSVKTRRENTLAKLTDVDQAQDAVRIAQTAYDQALHAAMKAEPDKTVAQLDTSTLSAERTELDGKLGALTTARNDFAALPEDDKTALNEWFAAVPDTLWEALESLDTALARLEKLHGPPTPNDLVTAMNNAESSLMTALDAARTAQRKTLGSEAAAQRAGRIRAAELDTSGLRARAFARSSALF